MEWCQNALSDMILSLLNFLYINHSFVTFRTQTDNYSFNDPPPQLGTVFSDFYVYVCVLNEPDLHLSWEFANFEKNGTVSFSRKIANFQEK